MNDPGESEGLRKRVPDNAASATAPSPLDEPSSNSSAVGTGIGPVVYVQADPDNLRGGATAGAPINGTVSGPTSSTSPSPNKLNCLNNKVLIRSLVVGFIISLVLTAIVVGFWFSWKSGPASVDQTDFNYLNTTEEEAGACLLGLRNDTGYDAKILFYFTFGQVDLETFELPSKWGVIACGNQLVDDQGFVLESVELYVNQEKTNLEAGTATVSGTQDWTLSGGPLYTFPFDVWTVNIICNAIIRNSTRSYYSLAVGVVINPISSSYIINPTLLPQNYFPSGFLATSVIIPTTIARTSTSTVLVVFIACAMWTLSLSMLITALDAAFIRPHRIEADVVGASISLLFALPQLRDGMPQVPPIGYAQVDVFAYSVCLLISAIAAIILIWDFLVKTHVMEGTKGEEATKLAETTTSIRVGGTEKAWRDG